MSVREEVSQMTLAECLSSLFGLSVWVVPTDATSWLFSDVLGCEIEPMSAHAYMVSAGFGERRACVVNNRFGFPMAIYALGSYGYRWQLFSIR